MKKINIVLANAHQAQAERSDIQREVKDIQKFFNERDFLFKQGTVNFVLIRGLYSHIERSLNVVGVFVNKAEHVISGLEADLSFQVKDQPDAKLAGVALQLPPSFLGEIKPNEGFILHMKVPVQGLTNEKQVYEATELSGTLANVKIAYPTE
ncbi:hypothetical protein [Pseudogracilibacillus sp. SO30301A]|uniref:hypothetical protein n=1 Tax=Pseudogracilibacillus sp. SO30301A TaxID=3098291 RepID=UPI00300E3547